jgi:Tol biopolymer transport system component
VRNPENSDITIYDLERDTPTRLTFDPGADRHPIWTPDGERVVFSSDRDGVLNIYERAADGTGQAQRLTTSDTEQWPQSWSADGQSLVVMDFGAGGAASLQIVSLGAESRTDGLIQTEFDEYYAEVSPDGRWIAYVSNESGQVEVYVRPFPNVDDGRWQISRDGGFSPVWAPTGQELFFRRLNLEMMVVAVETEPTFSHSNPEVMFAAPYRAGLPGRARPFDLSPDGERFLMIKEDAAGDEPAVEPHIVFVENWFEELKARVPVP